MNASACTSLVLLLGLAAPVPAAASSSDWFETQGGSIRIVTAGKPDESGRISGMLDIALKPGWKTYWIDPGDTGVPPQIDVASSSNISAATMAFPAPQRHDDGDNVWAGYDYPVAFPITFTVQSPNQPVTINASVFLGICETICIPVQASLTVEPSADPDNAGDAALVAAATGSLPQEAKPEFGVKVIEGGEGGKNEVLVEAVMPPGYEATDFFLAASDGFSFGMSEPAQKDGKQLFSVKVLDRPGNRPEGAGLHFTLTTTQGAVSGLLPYP